MNPSEFDSQSLNIENTDFRVELKYESQFLEKKRIENEEYIQKIELSDSDASNLIIKIFKKNREINCGIITGINGGTWLATATDKENSQTVQLENSNLILSLGFNLVSIEIPTLKLNWNIEPDPAEIFEFYNLEEDILIRGELQIHRIDLNGNVKWSYGGKDIWVNIEGKPEVTILENKIKLIDFDDNEYVINFEGNTITENPSNRITENFDSNKEKRKKNIWWEFWKKKK